MTGLCSLKDIQNWRQNRSKNKLVRENAVTRAHGTWLAPAPGIWPPFIIQYKIHRPMA